LMFTETKTKKDKRLLSGENTTVQTKDGSLSMLINQERKELPDTTENMVCISTDYSTSDQDSQ
jgi:hypothetical protein